MKRWSVLPCARADWSKNFVPATAELKTVKGVLEKSEHWAAR